MLVGNADLHDACELPAEPRHRTAFPVPIVGFDDTGDGVDETGTVVTDDGDNEDCHGATLLTRSAARCSTIAELPATAFGTSAGDPNPWHIGPRCTGRGDVCGGSVVGA